MIATKRPGFTVILLSCISVLQLTVLPLSSADAKTKVKSSKPSVTVQSTTTETTDEAAVRAQLDLLQKYLAEGNADALASLWTVDGNYINDAGVTFNGRDALTKKFGDVFATEGKQLVTFVSTSTRTLSPGVVVAEGLVKRQGAGADAAPETRFSMVFVKRDGGWWISQANEQPYIAQTSFNPLKFLSWMVGDWKAEKDGGFVRMKADWVANGNFLSLQYQIKQSASAPEVDSRQVIGWDPRTGQPISWHFDSNGGFGYGDWIKKDNQWMVRATGVERDGSISTATNVMSAISPNSFNWQSVSRSVNGIAFSDTSPLKIERVVK